LFSFVRVRRNNKYIINQITNSFADLNRSAVVFQNSFSEIILFQVSFWYLSLACCRAVSMTMYLLFYCGWSLQFLLLTIEPAACSCCAKVWS